MQFELLAFNALSGKQLFEIYKLRSKVFVVEQNCPYQDVDDLDLSALHLLMTEGETLVGYCRILPPGLCYTECAIGRVVVAMEYRERKLGRLLMKECIHKTLELFNKQEIVISAQTYLTAFYQSLGFVSEGEGYLEDDIPHIKMRLVPAV